MLRFRLTFVSIWILTRYLSLSQSSIYVDVLTKNVDGNGALTSPCPNLACGLKFAQKRDTIYVSPGLYTGPNNSNLCVPGFNSNCSNLGDVKIIGQGPPESINFLCMPNRSNVITIFKNTINYIANLSFINCLDTISNSVDLAFSTVVLINSSLTIENAIFSGNRAASGGALFADGTNVNLALNNVLFENNIATLRGGAIAVSSKNGSISIFNSSFVNNSVTGHFSHSDEFSSLSAGFGGAISIYNSVGQDQIFTRDSSVLISDSTFRLNRAFSAGGALNIVSNNKNPAYFISRNVKFSNNSVFGSPQCVSAASCAVRGGAMALTLFSGLILNNSFLSNSAETPSTKQVGQGGAISLTTLYESPIEQFSFVIENCLFNENFASNFGGAVYIINQHAILKDVKFSRNFVGSSESDLSMFLDSPTAGGALWHSSNQQMLVVQDCHFVDNKVYGGWGGAVYITTYDNAALIISSFFAFNRAFSSYIFPGQGGAIRADLLQTLNITDSTFQTNWAGPRTNTRVPAPYSGSGGAVYIQSITQAYLSSTTFLNNTAVTGESDIGSGGGAILLENSYMIITDCYFKENNAPGVFGYSAYSSSGVGGAIQFLFAAGQIQRTNFSNNFVTVGGSAASSGGAIAISYYDPAFRSIEITYCKFNNNTALGKLLAAGLNAPSGNGGAISLIGTVTPLIISNSSFSFNVAQANKRAMSSSHGGAIASKFSGGIVMSNVNFIRNWAFGGFGNDLSASFATSDAPESTNSDHFNNPSNITCRNCLFRAPNYADVLDIKAKISNLTSTLIKQHQSSTRKLLIQDNEGSDTSFSLSDIESELHLILAQLRTLNATNKLPNEGLDFLDSFSSSQLSSVSSSALFFDRLDQHLGDTDETLPYATFIQRRALKTGSRKGSSLQELLMARWEILTHFHQKMSQKIDSESTTNQQRILRLINSRGRNNTLGFANCSFYVGSGPVFFFDPTIYGQYSIVFGNLGLLSQLQSGNVFQTENTCFASIIGTVTRNSESKIRLVSLNSYLLLSYALGEASGIELEELHLLNSTLYLSNNVTIHGNSSITSSFISSEKPNVNIFNNDFQDRGLATLKFLGAVTTAVMNSIVNIFVVPVETEDDSIFLQKFRENLPSLLPTVLYIDGCYLQFNNTFTVTNPILHVDFDSDPDPIFGTDFQMVVTNGGAIIVGEGASMILNKNLDINALHTNIPNTKSPTLFPSSRPTPIPTYLPSFRSTLFPTSTQPTLFPSVSPTSPSLQPTPFPTGEPSARPTVIPTDNPSARPTIISCRPTTEPTAEPTARPTVEASPTFEPTVEPTSPTFEPTAEPTTEPTTEPTRRSTPTPEPNFEPTFEPTRRNTPSFSPSLMTSEPTFRPTSPTSLPTFLALNKSEVYPVLKNYGNIILQGSTFNLDSPIDNNKNLPIYKFLPEPPLSSTSYLRVNAILSQSLTGSIEVYLNNNSQSVPLIALYTNGSLLGQIIIRFPSNRSISPTYDQSWSILQYDHAESNPLGVTFIQSPRGVQLSSKTISENSIFTTNVQVEAISCSSLYTYVDISTTSLCAVCESKQCSFCGAKGGSNQGSTSMSSNPQYCVDHGAQCPSDTTYYSWNTCCMADCGENGDCIYNNLDLYGTCNCNSQFYTSDNRGSCESLSSLSIALIASGSGFFSILVLSFFYYRYSQEQKTVVLEELRQGLLENLDSQTDQDYIRSMQQALILKDVFVKYEDIKIEEQVGEGSFGVVYKATFRGAQVALKQMKSMFLELSDKDIDEFRKEAYMMSRLRHPNIVLVMGISLVDKPAPMKKKNRNDLGSKPPPKIKSKPEKTVCIITEYLEQGSLSDILYGPSRLPAEVWTYERILSCALQAARGMLYLHSHTPAIIHRDLKSSNLVVDEHWVVKVTDFGMSRIVPESILEMDKEIASEGRKSFDERSFDSKRVEEGKSNVSKGMLESPNRGSIGSLSRQNLKELGLDMTSNLGTTAWCAPELLTLTQITRYSVKVDVYSFGMVLWEMWEKKRPFEELTSRFDIIEHIKLGKRPALSESCPAPLKSLIERCWQTDPTRRPMFNYIVRYLKDELARIKRMNQAPPTSGNFEIMRSFSQDTASTQNTPSQPSSFLSTFEHSLNYLSSTPIMNMGPSNNSLQHHTTSVVRTLDDSCNRDSDPKTILMISLSNTNPLHDSQRIPICVIPPGGNITNNILNNNDNADHESSTSTKSQIPPNQQFSSPALSSSWRDRYVMKFSGWKSSQPDSGLPPSLTGRIGSASYKPSEGSNGRGLSPVIGFSGSAGAPTTLISPTTPITPLDSPSSTIPPPEEEPPPEELFEFDDPDPDSRN